MTDPATPGSDLDRLDRLDDDAATIASDQAGGRRTLFGQPIGLATLFLTEMWERFTYYGMRAILILFLVGAVEKNGFGIDDKTANAIYGLYISGTYLLSVFGGWIADRLTGAQRAVWWGGILIFLGNTLLAVGAAGTPKLFFFGLVLIVFGVGLLKPNISAIVAQLYPEGGSRRDAGFSIFYMGINTGALLGSTIVPLLAGTENWTLGFGASAFFMLVGLVQFYYTRHWLLGAGKAPGVSQADEGKRRTAWTVVVVLTAVMVAVCLGAIAGIVQLDATVLLESSFWAMVAFSIIYFAYLLFFAGLDGTERKRVVVMIALFVACMMFWAGFEQTGASLNLFAERYTDRVVFGWEVPAGTLQNINPFFIIVFSPIFAALWVKLGQRNLDPSAPAKFGMGLVFMGVGFVVMYFAAQYVVRGQTVLPTWLILTYMFHTWGELCLSPVGLSSMSKLVPNRFVGQALGVWFLATAMGNNLAGQISAEFDSNNVATMPGQFLYIVWWGLIGGAVMFVITPVAKRLMGGVK
jgi:proton-dependent oligopeptide transporter, POT family